MSNNEICGMYVSVIGRDCTANGVTSGKTRAVVVWPGMIDNYDRVFRPNEDAPLLEIEFDEGSQLRAGYLAVHKGKRTPRGFMSEYGGPPRIVRVRVKPYGKPAGSFGGHYIETSDSRFPFEGPIPVFDRYER